MVPNVPFQVTEDEHIREAGWPKQTTSCSTLDRITSASCAPVRPTVLLGFAEAATAPEVVWSLVDAGFDVVAFGRRGRSSALRHSRHVVCHDVCAPEENLETSLFELGSILSSLGKECVSQRILLPLDDKAVFLCSKLQLGDDWILAGPDGVRAELALNKHLQVEIARDAGFDVPKTRLVRTIGDIRDFIASESYPIILKSAECVPLHEGHVDACPNWICANAEELEGGALANGGAACLSWRNPSSAVSGEGIFGFAPLDGVRAWSAHGG